MISTFGISSKTWVKQKQIKKPRSVNVESTCKHPLKQWPVYAIDCNNFFTTPWQERTAKVCPMGVGTKRPLPCSLFSKSCKNIRAQNMLTYFGRIPCILNGGGGGGDDGY